MKNFLQYIANAIIKKMENTTHDDVFDFYYEFGMWLDNVAVNTFGIYLD